MFKIDWQYIDAFKFEELCGDIVRALLPPERRGTYFPTSMKYRRDFQCDGKIEFGGLQYLGLESPIIISCKTTDPNNDIKTANKAIKEPFLKGLITLATQKPESVILFSNHDLTPETIKKILEKINNKFVISFQGRTEIERHIRTHPHLLWKYFKHSWTLESFHSSDSEGLRKALLNNPLAEIIPLEKIKHPNIIDLNLDERQFVKIIGKPGSGKSVALWQLLIELDDTEIIIIHSLDTQQTWQHLQEILLNTNQKITLVIDDLHELMRLQQGQGFLASLINLASNLKNKVSILISYRSTQRYDVEKIIEPQIWNSWEFSDIFLDNVTREFIASIVDLTCNTLNITIEKKIQEGFIEGIAEWENTPACAVSSLKPYSGTHLKFGFFPVSLKERQSVWKTYFKSLRDNNRTNEINVLRFLTFLRECSLKHVNFNVLKEMYQILCRGELTELEMALIKLKEEGWLLYEKGVVSTHDIQITPGVVELVQNGKPSPWIEEVRELLENDKISSLREKRSDYLLYLSRFYWELKCYNTCEKLNSIVNELNPKDERPIFNIGMCRINMGRIDDGLSTLHKSVNMNPTNIRFLSEFFFLLLNYDRVDEARNLLEERVNNFFKLQLKINFKKNKELLDEDSSELIYFIEFLRFVSEAYGEPLKEWKKSLKYSKMLWQIKEDSNSAIRYAIAMNSIGKREQAKKFINKIMKKWPDDGVLNMLLSQIYKSNNNIDKAFEYAEKAIILSPNIPSTYFQYIIMLIEVRQFSKANDIIVRTKELNLHHPILMALEGIVKLGFNQPNESIKLLSQAVQYSYYFADIIAMNAYLALGSAYIQINKDEEAENAYLMAKKRGAEKWFCLANKGQALKITQRYDDAIKVLEEAIKDPQADERVMIDLLNLYVYLKKYDDIIHFLEHSLELKPPEEIIKLNNEKHKIYISALIKSSIIIDKLLLDAPDSLNVYHYALKLKYGCNDISTVFNLSNQFVDRNIKNINILFYRIRAILRLPASVMKNLKDEHIYNIYKKTFEEFHEILSQYNFTDELILPRVIILSNLGKKDEALEMLKLANTLNSNSSDDWFLASISFKNIDANDEAVFCLEQAIKLNSEIISYYISLSNILLLLDRSNEALDTIDRTLKLDKENIMLIKRKAEILSIIGSQERSLIEYKKVISIYEKEPEKCLYISNIMRLPTEELKDDNSGYGAMPLNINISDVYKELSINELSHNNKRKAEEYLNKAVALSPKDWQLHFLLAQIFINNDDKENAKKELEMIFSITDHPMHLHQTAQLLVDIGESLKADELRKKAVEYCGENKESHVEIIEELRNLRLFEGAFYHIKKLIELNPADYISMNTYANYCTSKNNNEEALKYYDKAIDVKPDYYDAWYNKGLALLNLGNNEEAIKCFERTIEIQKDKHEAWTLKGIALIFIGLYDEAIVCLDKAIELYPENFEAWCNKAKIYGDLGKYDESVYSYNKAIEIKPGNYEAWYGKGVNLRILEKDVEALLCFDKALEIKPDSFEIWSSKGITLDMLGNHDDAIKCFNKAIEFVPINYDGWYGKAKIFEIIKKNEEALQCYDITISMKPDFYLAWYDKGMILFNLEKFKEAIICFEKAIDIKPDFYDAWYYKGSILGDLGQHKAALKCFNEAIKIKSDSSMAWCSKGLTLNNIEKPEEAIKCFDKAIKIDTTSLGPWYLKGKILNILEKPEEAIKCFDKVIKINSDFYEAWYEKGNAYGILKKYNESIKCYDEAIKIKSDYFDAWCFKGIAYENLVKSKKAIKCYDKAIEIDKTSSGVWYFKGLSLDNLDKLEEALNCYDKSIVLKSDVDDAWYNKGLILMKMDKNEDAVDCFNKVIEINSNYLWAWYYKGVILDNLEKKEEAIICYDKSIELKSDFIEAFFAKGIALNILKNDDDAILCYDKVIELKPDNEYAWNNKGMSLIKLSKYDEAIKCFNEAIIINPKEVSYYQSMAEAYIVLNNFYFAIETLNNSEIYIKEVEKKSINLYFKCIAHKMLGNKIDSFFKEFIEILNEDFNVSWDFGDIEHWLKNTEINEYKKAFIIEITEMIKKKRNNN